MRQQDGDAFYPDAFQGGVGEVVELAAQVGVAVLVETNTAVGIFGIDLHVGRADRAMRLLADQAGQESLVSLIIKLGLLSDKDLAIAVSNHTNLPIIEKKEYPDELVESEQVSLKFLKENKVLLLDEDQDYLITAIADPFEKYVFDFK